MADSQSQKAWCGCGNDCDSHCIIGLTSGLDSLFLAETEADVIFELPDGVEIKAHKLIISAQVAVFEKMFSSGMSEAQSNRVKITDCDADTFKAFIRFLYGGKLYEPFDWDKMLYLASKYGVPDLARAYVPKFKADLTKIRGTGEDVKLLIGNMPLGEGSVNLTLIREHSAKVLFASERLSLMKRLDLPFPQCACASELFHSTTYLITASANISQSLRGDALVAILIYADENALTELTSRCFEMLRSFRTKDLYKKLAGHPDLQLIAKQILPDLMH